MSAAAASVLTMATHWTLGCDAADPQVREEHYDGELGHVVMLDPEGNEFCVA